MLYRKNVPVWERVLRILAGIGLAALSFFVGPQLGAPAGLVITLLIGSAVFVAVTGFVGWCPACAMVGRKLKNQEVRGQ